MWTYSHTHTHTICTGESAFKHTHTHTHPSTEGGHSLEKPTPTLECTHTHTCTHTHSCTEGEHSLRSPRLHLSACYPSTVCFCANLVLKPMLQISFDFEAPTRIQRRKDVPNSASMEEAIKNLFFLGLWALNRCQGPWWRSDTEWTPRTIRNCFLGHKKEIHFFFIFSFFVMDYTVVKMYVAT